ncbi:MAG: murein L,D-transpeptidase family protein [Rhizobiaceae bacterium]|nr:murein L,D-transpeptidase family protein [Rhizobiaceae bacterium]
MAFRASKLVTVVFAGTVLAACNGVLESSVPKHEKPVPEYLTKKMKTKGMSLGAPILLRIFKEENVMEVWKQDHTKRYALLNSYEICKWSGKLGPKHKEGDRQAPEGFYHVTPGLMNPNSSYHLSFNMGFPNAYDRANDRTGSYLMIHGACSSAGCYSMTDEYVEEIYAMAREAFKGGQKAFQIQAYPFRMTAENLAQKVGHQDFEFWKMLKEGSDHFEVTRKQPKVDVCEKRYVFNRYADEGERFQSRAICPPAKMPRSLALAFNQKQEKDQSVFDKVLKRNASNLFVKPEDKPRIAQASIKASPTQGALGILEPKPVVAAVPLKPEADESNDTSTDNATKVIVGEQDANPISAEVSAPDTSASQQAEGLERETLPNTAVPEKANRPTAATGS